MQVECESRLPARERDGESPGMVRGELALVYWNAGVHSAPRQVHNTYRDSRFLLSLFFCFGRAQAETLPQRGLAPPRLGLLEKRHCVPIRPRSHWTLRSFLMELPFFFVVRAAVPSLDVIFIWSGAQTDTHRADIFVLISSSSSASVSILTVSYTGSLTLDILQVHSTHPTSRCPQHYKRPASTLRRSATATTWPCMSSPETLSVFTRRR